jgi:uncharacterized damage-inducible protein DinB
MLTATLTSIFRRDLAALRREVEAYPDESTLWVTRADLRNSGGVLTRHICGNLQHFIGAILGDSGYYRDREAEFAAPPTPRAELLDTLATTEVAVLGALSRLAPEQLAAPFPQAISGLEFRADDLLVHLAVHCSFHLGQVDMHRRLLTGATMSIQPMGLTGLASAHEAGTPPA